MESIAGYDPIPIKSSTKHLLALDPGPGGMNRAENGIRLDRQGRQINKREGNMKKDRKNKMAHKITFAD